MKFNHVKFNHVKFLVDYINFITLVTALLEIRAVECFSAF